MELSDAMSKAHVAAESIELSRETLRMSDREYLRAEYDRRRAAYFETTKEIERHEAVLKPLRAAQNEARERLDVIQHNLCFIEHRQCHCPKCMYTFSPPREIRVE